MGAPRERRGGAAGAELAAAAVALVPLVLAWCTAYGLFTFAGVGAGHSSFDAVSAVVGVGDAPSGGPGPERRASPRAGPPRALFLGSEPATAIVAAGRAAGRFEDAGIEVRAVETAGLGEAAARTTALARETGADVLVLGVTLALLDDLALVEPPDATPREPESRSERALVEAFTANRRLGEVEAACRAAGLELVVWVSPARGPLRLYAPVPDEPGVDPAPSLRRALRAAAVTHGLALLDHHDASPDPGAFDGPVALDASGRLAAARVLAADLARALAAPGAEGDAR